MPPETKNGVCLACGSGVLRSGEHIRDDLPPCYGGTPDDEGRRLRRTTPQATAARIVADVLTDATTQGHPEYAGMARDAQNNALFLEGRCPHPRIIVDREYGSFCDWCGDDYRGHGL